MLESAIKQTHHVARPFLGLWRTWVEGSIAFVFLLAAGIMLLVLNHILQQYVQTRLKDMHSVFILQPLYSCLSLSASLPLVKSVRPQK